VGSLHEPPDLVFGDSTPFPYALDYIELVKGVVECGVGLLQAQRALEIANDQAAQLFEGCRREQERFDAMLDTLKLSMTAFMSSPSGRVAQLAGRVLDTTRGMIVAERGQISERAVEDRASAEAAADEARAAAYRTMEAFLLHHDVPPTGVAVRLLASEDRYGSQAALKTPFGVECAFSLLIPLKHEWARLKRVGQIQPGAEVQVPKGAGWGARSGAMRTVRLDKLFLSEVLVGSNRVVLWLRRNPTSGPGQRLEILAAAAPRATVQELNEHGQPAAGQPIELSGEDFQRALQLSTRVIQSTADLSVYREAMTAASFEGQPLRELDEPKQLCARLLEVVTPVVREIVRRSGAPGELMLRRNLGQGRREELYVTKAELNERVMTLPPVLRALFDPLQLATGPRSARAPQPSASHPL
jgi:hypothetical protein